MIRANSVSRALAVIGDRWSLLMLAAAFQGARRFDDWRRGIGIATNVLAERLNRLVDNGCLVRVPVGEGQRRQEYRLTPMGAAFYPTALMFWRFDRRWSRKRRLQPASLVHTRCSSRTTACPRRKPPTAHKSSPASTSSPTTPARASSTAALRA